VWLRARRSPLGVVALVALVIVLGFGLLYASRAQVPARPQIPYTQALSEIQDGQVRSVTVEGERAVLVLQDGRTQEATVPDRGEVLTRIVAERNRSDPARQTELRYQQPAPESGVVLSILLSLLPLLLIVALVLLAAYAFARARAPDPYEALARLADLRDRGAINDEEFQAEKRRLLR
jgi:ATP-dependent Zn protease